MIPIQYTVLLNGLMLVKQQLLLFWEYITTSQSVLMVATICHLIAFRVSVAVKRVGGGFGGKITGSHQIAAACALAAYHTKKSVTMCRLAFTLVH